MTGKLGQRQRTKDCLDGLLSAQGEAHRPSTNSRGDNDTTNARETDQVARSNSTTSYIQPDQLIQRATTDARLDEAAVSSQMPMPSLDSRWTMQSSLQSSLDDETLHELFPTWPVTSPSAVENSIPCPPLGRDSERPGTHSDLVFGSNSISNILTESSSINDDSIDQNGQKDTITHGGFDLGRIITAGIETLLRGSPSQASPSPSRLPDPWSECIHFTRSNIILACIQNAQSMGFKVEDVMMPERLASSPFYQPLIAPTDDPKKLLEDVTSPTTPAHLKPTLPQVLYPHPAFLDLIPMPDFRARVITLLATHPHVIDMMDLKKDVAFEMGICYWASLGSEGIKSTAAQAAHGQPWDMRSWEVAPWFLCKWRVLFGGDGEEIWKQSHWWQRARGEFQG